MRDVEDLLAESLGLDVSYETVRRWVLKFGQIYAKQIGARATTANRPGLASVRDALS